MALEQKREGTREEKHLFNRHSLTFPLLHILTFFQACPKKKDASEYHLRFSQKKLNTPSKLNSLSGHFQFLHIVFNTQLYRANWIPLEAKPPVLNFEVKVLSPFWLGQKQTRYWLTPFSDAYINIYASPSRQPFWGSPTFPRTPASRGLHTQCLMIEFGRRGAVRHKGWQGGWICIVPQGPWASQIQAPGINPLLGYNPIQPGVAPRLAEQRTGRSEGRRVTWGRANSDTFTRLRESKTKRPLSSLSLSYTPPPTYPPTNKYHTAPTMPCPGFLLVLWPADQG